jgi:hypothetical protein
MENPQSDPNFTRTDYSERFKAETEVVATLVTTEMYHLTMRKNNDYGGHTDPWKNFREFGILGIIVRMSDKWARIKSFFWEKRAFQVLSETVLDTLYDLAVYTIIAIIWVKRYGHEWRTDSENNPQSA